MAYNGYTMEPLSHIKDLNISDEDKSRLRIHHIVTQIERAVSSAGPRRGTLFFQVVLGGNVGIAKQVVETLKSRRLTKELNWIMGQEVRSKKRCKWIRDDFCPNIMRLLIITILTAIWLIVSPLFYFFHALVVGLCVSSHSELQHDIELPLAFAALSNKPNMVQLFLDNGTRYDDVDSNGNNVFHYVSDLSQQDASKAQKMLKVLLQQSVDCNILKRAIMKQKNASRLTPLEHVLKCGSPKLLAKFLNLPGVNKSTHVVVDSDHIYVEGIDDDQLLRECDASATVTSYDVTDYETGTTSRFSSLLNIICNRNVYKVTEEEHDIWKSCKFLNKYLKLKVKQLFAGIVALHSFDIIFTILFTFWIVTRFEMMSFENVIDVSKQDIFFQELEARAANRSIILKDDAFSKIVLNMTGDAWISQNIAREFLALNEAKNINFQNFTLLKNQWVYCKEHCPSSKTLPGNISIHDIICIDSKKVHDHSFKQTLDKPPPDLYDDICELVALLGVVTNLCSDIKPEEIYKRLHDYKVNYYNVNIATICFGTMLIMSIVYIVFDLVERLFFLHVSVCESRVPSHLLIAISSTKLPGSYTRKQLNLFTHFCLLFYVSLPLFDENSLESIEKNIFLVCGLVNRFVLHIHSLRLLPSIGHFVITTFHMGTVMVHFSVVYVIILFTFSVVFHILIQNPLCPIEKMPGFSSLGESMFSTFRLVFGNTDDPDAFFINSSVKLTYVLYTIICGLLLLNLIIAIMSSLAQDVMVNHRMRTFWKAEWLKEALSAELTFDVSLLGRLTRIWCLRKAGFEICGDDVKIKVYESKMGT